MLLKVKLSRIHQLQKESKKTKVIVPKKEKTTKKESAVVVDSEDIQDKDGEALTNGYISLQSESHPVEFRKIQILEL